MYIFGENPKKHRKTHQRMVVQRPKTFPLFCNSLFLMSFWLFFHCCLLFVIDYCCYYCCRCFVDVVSVFVGRLSCVLSMWSLCVVVLSLSVLSLSVLSLSLCCLSLCVVSLCCLSLCVVSLCLVSLCVVSLSVLSLSVLSLSVLSLSVLSLSLSRCVVAFVV